MSVPGTAADVSISCSVPISTVPGTGPRVRNGPEDGTPAHRALSATGGVGGNLQLLVHPGKREVGFLRARLRARTSDGNQGQRP